jgi:hypothetical protein
MRISIIILSSFLAAFLFLPRRAYAGVDTTEQMNAAIAKLINEVGPIDPNWLEDFRDRVHKRLRGIYKNGEGAKLPTERGGGRSRPERVRYRNEGQDANSPPVERAGASRGSLLRRKK